MSLPIPVSLPVGEDTDVIYTNAGLDTVYVRRLVLVGEAASETSTTVTIQHKPAAGDAVAITGDFEVTGNVVDLDFMTSVPLKTGESLLGVITGSEACEGYVIIEKTNKALKG